MLGAFFRRRRVEAATHQAVRAFERLDGDRGFAVIDRLKRADERRDVLLASAARLTEEEEEPLRDAALDRALAIDPEFQPAVLQKATALGQDANRFDEALTWARRALDLAPRDSHAAILVARLLAGLGRPQEGLDLLRPFTATGDPWVALAFGEMTFGAGDDAAAVEVLGAVLEVAEHRQKITFAGHDFDDAGDLRRASQELFDAAYASLHGQEQLAVVHAQKGRMDARAGVNHKLLGQSLMRESTVRPRTLELTSVDALEAFAMSTHSGDPESAEAFIALGTAHLREGRAEPARDAFTRATELDGQHFAGFLGLGAALDLDRFRWREAVNRLGSAEPPHGIEAVCPDWPVLTPLERRVVVASVAPFARWLPLLAERGATARVLPIDVRPTDLPEHSEHAGLRFEDDHRAMEALHGLATDGLALSKVEDLLNVTADEGWVFAHEFAHLVHANLPDDLKARITEVFDAALDTEGLFQAYQLKDDHELFAVGYVEWLLDRYGLSAVEGLRQHPVGVALFAVIEAVGEPR